MEPFFCTIALYDIAATRKLSEDFHATVSPGDALDLLGSATLVRWLHSDTFPSFLVVHILLLMTYSHSVQRALEPATKAKKAVFTLHPSQKREDVYIVFIINKVLRGDLDKQFEVYGKGAVRSALRSG
jgi:hypothetical protein